VITFYVPSKREGFHKETISKRVRVNPAKGSSVYQVNCTSANCRLCACNTNYCDFAKGKYNNCVLERGNNSI
jgi:hypothetical protein